MSSSKKTNGYLYIVTTMAILSVIALFIYQSLRYQETVLPDETTPVVEKTEEDSKSENTMLRYLDPARKPENTYTGTITDVLIDNNVAMITISTDEQKDITLKYNLDQNTIVIHRLSADDYYPFKVSYQFGDQIVTILEYPPYQEKGEITIQLE